MKNPGKTIPRSVLLSLIIVAAIYVGINLSINGVIPWRSFVPESDHPESAYIASAFMEKLHGPLAAKFFTIMVLWTCLGSVFALLLGYSRIPYAAAQSGVFFKAFSKLHPTRGFPHLGLLLIGILAIACSFLSFSTVLDTLIALRILVQFIAQIAAVILLRRNQPHLARPYKVWLYPLPLLIAFLGWIFVFITSSPAVILFSLGSLAIGVGVFFAWSAQQGTWPFAKPTQPSSPLPNS